MWEVNLNLNLLYHPLKPVNGESLVYLVGMFDVQFVVPLLLVECMLGFKFSLFALAFLLLVDLCQKVGDMALLRLADYGIEWKHLYVASLTIDMVNHCARKLLSVGIPLSHTLCFLNLLLYATLQRSCSCSKRSMSMEFFPTCLTSPLTEYLHKFLGHLARTGGLVCRYIVMCWEWSVGLIRSVYFLIISVIIQL